jgi:hypothetical protein
VLAIAGRAAPALTTYTAAFDAVQKALADGWLWVEGESIRASQLYTDDVEALAVQGSLLAEKEPSAAMCAATSAFYYVMWHAFRQDLRTGRVSAGEVPNDIADVTEGVIEETCNFALQTSLCDRHWISALAERLLRDFQSAEADELGPIVRDHFVNVLGIANPWPP